MTDKTDDEIEADILSCLLCATAIPMPIPRVAAILERAMTQWVLAALDQQTKH